MAATSLGQPANRARLGQIPAILWALIGAVVLLGIVSPNSVKPVHLLDITRQAAPLIIAATGQTLVILCGGLDLSMGATITLVEVMAAQLISNDPTRVVPVALFGLAVGAFIGWINGLVVTRLRVAPFIATLGMNTLVLGAALIYSGGAPRGAIPENMRYWGTGFIFKAIPAAALVWLALAVIVGIVLTRTVYGRRVYATGANPRTAFLSGINVDRIRASTYVVSGLLAALAGLELAAYIGTGSLTIGNDYMLNTLAAVVLGGTPFTGGRGSLFATVLASLFMYIVFSILTGLSMGPSGRLMTQGVIILVALAVQAMRGK